MLNRNAVKSFVQTLHAVQQLIHLCALVVQQGIIKEEDECGAEGELANLTLGADGEEKAAKGPQTTKKGGKLKDGDKVLPGGKVPALCTLASTLI